MAELKKTNKQTRETDLYQMQAGIVKSAATSLSALETSLDTTMQTMTTIDQRMTDQLDVLTSQVDELLDVASAWFEEIGIAKTSPAEGSGEPQEFLGRETASRLLPSAPPMPSGETDLCDSVASMPITKKGESIFTKSWTITMPVLIGQ